MSTDVGVQVSSLAPKKNGSSEWTERSFFIRRLKLTDGSQQKSGARTKSWSTRISPVTPTFDLAFDSAVSPSEAASCFRDLSRASTRCAAAPMLRAAEYLPHRGRPSMISPAFSRRGSFTHITAERTPPTPRNRCEYSSGRASDFSSSPSGITQPSSSNTK